MNKFQIIFAGNNLPTLNSNYHHFADPADFHHHNHTHNLHNQILNTGHNQRGSQHHNNNLVNHHMLSRANHSTATSTAAAVAAAMMLDPRFHHNSSVSVIKVIAFTDITHDSLIKKKLIWNNISGSLSSIQYTSIYGNGCCTILSTDSSFSTAWGISTIFAKLHDFILE